MTKVKIHNGDLAEDTCNDETATNKVSPVYTFIRYLRDEQGAFRYSLRDQQRRKRDDESYTLPEDSDVVQYHNLLCSLEVEGHDVGAVQAAVTSFTNDEYFDFHNLGDAIETRPANETEQRLSDATGPLSDKNQAVTSHFPEPMVPLTPDKEEMPLLVMSNERNEGTMDFEEAKEMLDRFLDHLDVEVLEGDAPDVDTNHEPRSEDTDSDGLLRGADGVGSEVSEQIREYVVENRVTIDWKDEVEADSAAWRQTVTTKDDVTGQLQAVAVSMPNDEFTDVMSLIEDGNLEQAQMAISQYE